jgi:hypothetical protein
MIREEYKQQLIQTRQGWKEWGGNGARNGGLEIGRMLDRAIPKLNVRSVLDFGAGRGTLGEYIRERFPKIEWTDYDPSVEGIDKVPRRTFDVIVSTDVMEHIEPESLNDTLAWIREHADIAQFHMIACGPTNRKLPDGRDVHLIQQPMKWWVPKFTVDRWILSETGVVEQARRGTIRQRGWVYVEKLPC